MFLACGNQPERCFARLSLMLSSLGIVLTLLTTPAVAGNYAVLIGVGKYDSSDWEPVPSSTNETMEFADILRAQVYNGTRQFDEVVTICDDSRANFSPTKQTITTQLKAIAKRIHNQDKLRANHDSLTVVLNGHGVELENEKHVFTFCPKDAKIDDKSSRLTISEILDCLVSPTKNDERLVPEQFLLIVNACRYQPYIKPKSNLSSAEPGRQWRLGFDPKNDQRLKDSKRLGSDEVKGAAVLFACGTNQKSYIDLTKKDDKDKRSYFFTALKLGWSGAADADSRNPDGKVSLFELSQYLEETVGVLAKGEDEPQVPEVRTLGNDSVAFSNWIVNTDVAFGHDPNRRTVAGRLPSEFWDDDRREWSNYVFSGVDFSGKTISFKNLENCKFVNCNLEFAKMDNQTTLAGASFVGCRMKSLDLRKATACAGIVYEGRNEGEEEIRWGLSGTAKRPAFFAPPKR